MIADIDPLKSALTSIASAAFGSFTKYCMVVPGFISLQAANTFFQHLAWTVAILAGIVSIINGVAKWCKKKPNEDN